MAGWELFNRYFRADWIDQLADWGHINGYPFVGSSSPIAPYEKLPRIWFGRAKLEALKPCLLVAFPASNSPE